MSRDPIDNILNELEYARNNHEDFNSRWEGFCVLQEEICELWKEVRKKEPSKKFMRQEAIQVAAMTIKFIKDCCGSSRCPTCGGLGFNGRSAIEAVEPCPDCGGSGKGA